MARFENPARRVVTLLIVAAMLWPLVSNNDGLPLSTYPMYAGARSDTLAFVTASGVTAGGASVRLSTPQIAQTRDPLIAQSFLNDAVADRTTDVVCREIASRLGDGQVVTVEIAREVHNVVAFVRDDTSLVERVRLARCEVSP